MKYNAKTVGHYTILGGGVFAPVLHFWYRWLDRVLPGQTSRNVCFVQLILFAGTTGRIIIRKVALDISVFALPYYTAFYVSLNLLSGANLQESLAELKQKLLPTILSTTAFWLPAQTVNFR